MKRINLTLGLLLSVLLLASCGGGSIGGGKLNPTVDFEIMLEGYEAFGDLALEVAADGIITKDEKNQLMKCFGSFYSIVLRSRGDSDWIDHMRLPENISRFNKIENHFFNGKHELEDCEGYDDFKAEVTSKYDTGYF